MKKYIVFYVLAVALAVATFSCQKAPILTMTGTRTFTFSKDGGVQSFAFSTNRDWTISSSESWCHISPSSGVASDGDITVSISVDKNNTYDSRSCTITIKAEELTETVTIKQEMSQGLIVYPTNFNITNAAQKIEIEVKKNVNYIITIDAACKDWITKAGTKALSSEIVVFNIANNGSYDDREGIIEFIQADGDGKQSVLVKQSQKNDIVIDNSDFELSNASQTLNIEVKTNVNYVVSSQSDWISVVETKGLKTTSITLSIDKNNDQSYRTGTVIVSSIERDINNTITIKQRPSPIVTTATATNINALSSTLNGSVEVESAMTIVEEVSFLLCKEQSSIDEIKKTGERIKATIDKKGHFNASVTGLSSASNYYYVACVKVFDEEYFGEVVKFTTPEIKATLTTSDALNVGWSKAILQGTLSVEQASLFDKEVWFMYSDKYKTLDDLLNKGIKYDSSVSKNAQPFSVSLSALSSSSNYYFVVCAKVHDKEFYGEVKHFKTKTIPKGAVDLGLSVCWADCNVGATKPEEWGGYYAWGETKTKQEYTWETYSHVIITGKNEWRLTKYCSSWNYGYNGLVDNLTILEKVDDAVYNEKGGSWRMATLAEWKELLNPDNCTWTSGASNNVKGVIVRSIIPGYENSYIFLPAAGHHSHKDDEHGWYWTSETEGNLSAYLFSLNKSYSDNDTVTSRCYGASVRGVTD